MLTPHYGVTFEDLYSVDGLARVDAAFLTHLEHADAALHARLRAGRADAAALSRLDESELLIAIARHLEDFIALLFGIVPEVSTLQAAQNELAPIYACKRQVVQRKALNRYKADVAAGFDGAALRAMLEPKLGVELAGLVGELAFARAVGTWAQDEAAHEADIDLALRYAAWAVQTPEGRARHKAGVLFKAPRKLDFMRLIPVQAETRHDVAMLRLPDDHVRRREGFALTDQGTDLAGGLDQAHYCIWCHEQQKDSCSSGMREKKSADSPPARHRPTRRSRNRFSASRSPAARWKKRSPSSTSCAAKAGRWARWRSSASTIRWSRRPGTASATTA